MYLQAFVPFVILLFSSGRLLLTNAAGPAGPRYSSNASQRQIVLFNGYNYPKILEYITTN